MSSLLSTSTRPDIAIIGGGVAGSALATVLARLGWSVHLIERIAPFKDRIRGETIHPWGVAELRALGLYDIVIERADAQEQLFWQRYVDREPMPPYRWADDFPDAPNGLGFAHVDLQEAMLDAARDAGAIIHRPASVELVEIGDAPLLDVIAGHRTFTLAPRLVVGADGEHSATRRWIGGVATSDPIHHHLGGAMIEGLGLLPDRIHQAFFDGGMIFASPVARDTARVYMVCSSEEAMAIQAGPDRAASIVERFRASVPNGLLGDAWRSTGPVAFFPNASTVVDVPPTSRFVLIGDAMGRNDPSQGHGLSLVFHDVRTLAGMLATEPDWSVVPDAFHNRARAYRETLRQHAHWVERQATETGPEIDELKARIARARDVDPGAGGFAAIFAIGPDSLVADDAARRHFLGEDLEPAHTANQGRLAG